MRNIVIVCSPCNGRKASLTYEQWIERVEPEHRGRVISLRLKRYPALNLDLIAGAQGAPWSGACGTSQPGA